MNALEAKALRERYAALVAGDPIGNQLPRGPFDIVLGNENTVRVDEVAKALGGLDRNRVVHHLYARGFLPSEADSNVFERRAWHSLPWPAVEDVRITQPDGRTKFTFASAISGGGGKLGSAVSGGGDVLASARDANEEASRG